MKKITLILAHFVFWGCESIQDVISPAEITASMSLTQTSRGGVSLKNLSKNGGPFTMDGAMANRTTLMELWMLATPTIVMEFLK